MTAMSKKAKKMFITGSEGFIGGHLKTALLKHGIAVRGYDIRFDRRDDVCDYRRFKNAVTEFQPDGIVHLAAVSRVEDGFLDPRRCVEVNVGGTANVLEIIRELKNRRRSAPWCILGSSREVFGEPEKFPVTEKSPKNAINIYGVAKLSGEMLAENYAKNYGVKVWILRFSNVYTGLTDRPERVIPTFIRQALSNKLLTINGGAQVFAFAHIADTVRGIVSVIKKISASPRLFEDFNLVGNQKVKIVDLAKTIIRLADSRSRLVFNEGRRYDVNNFWGSFAKAKKNLGWEPKVDLQTGLTKAIAEFRQAMSRES
jgi:nucleoside-diphosphate-sugar epimerase